MTTILRQLQRPMAIAFCSNSSVTAMPLAIEASEDLGRGTGLAALIIPLGLNMNRHSYATLFALLAVCLAQIYGHVLGPIDVLVLAVLAALTGMAAIGPPAVVAPLAIPLLIALDLPAAGVLLLVAVSPLLDPMISMLNLFGPTSMALAVESGAREPEVSALEPALPAAVEGEPS